MCAFCTRLGPTTPIQANSWCALNVGVAAPCTRRFIHTFVLNAVSKIRIWRGKIGILIVRDYLDEQSFQSLQAWPCFPLQTPPKHCCDLQDALLLHLALGGKFSHFPQPRWMLNFGLQFLKTKMFCPNQASKKLIIYPEIQTPPFLQEAPACALQRLLKQINFLQVSQSALILQVPPADFWVHFPIGPPRQYLEQMWELSLIFLVRN